MFYAFCASVGSSSCASMSCFSMHTMFCMLADPLMERQMSRFTQAVLCGEGSEMGKGAGGKEILGIVVFGSLR